MDFDYYKELNVPKNASGEEIRKSYRKLAMKYHPDRTQGDAEKEEKFKRINVAHEVLSDQQKRQEYDSFGTVGGRSSSAYSQEFNVDLGDLFNQFFGSGGSQRQRRYDPTAPVKGEDIELTIKVNLEQVVAGANVKFEFQGEDACNKCEGSGVDNSKAVSSCHRCRGEGVLQSGNSFFAVNQTCGACGGTGSSQPYCKLCGGRKIQRAKRKIDFKLPEGIDDQQYVRMRNKGNGGLNNGPNGDLYLKISIKPHSLFTRNGLDLSCTLPATLTDCLLGKEIAIPTIGGQEVKLKIPECSQPNDIITLKKQGITRNGQSGDIFVKLQLSLPKKLSDKQKKLLKEFRDTTESVSIVKDSANWLDSLKSYASKVTDYVEEKISK